MDDPDTDTGRDRILAYFKKYVGEVLAGGELMVVAGIDDYARRIRELRVEFGWSILSGVTVSEIRKEGSEEAAALPAMKPVYYLLASADQDRDAAHRWRVGNEIRKEKLSVQDKILKYLLANIGKEITGEELRYMDAMRLEYLLSDHVPLYLSPHRSGKFVRMSVWRGGQHHKRHAPRSYGPSPKVRAA